MKHLLFRLLPKVALGSLLALGLTTGLAASNAQPARAGVIVSVGFGGGYAPSYHWHRWHDGYGWHRAWVPFGWAPPVAIWPGPAYDHPARVAYYGRAYYGRPYSARDFRARDFHDRWAYAHREFHP
jgi:hypothetical protein